MIRDINTKKVMKNAYRITKNRYQTSLRVREMCIRDRLCT